MEESKHEPAPDMTQQQAAEGDVESKPRREFIKNAAMATAAVGAVSVAMHELDLVKPAHAAEGTIAGTPMAEKWWPSRWGKDDQVGATNWMGPKTTMDAIKQIKTGKVYSLGRVYEAGMPLFGSRVFSLRIPGAPTGGAYGKNGTIWHDEIFTAEIGQVGTQFDGLGHIGCRTGAPGEQGKEVFYNGFTTADLHNTKAAQGSTVGAYGLQALGVENIKPFFTRGVLFDVMGLRGRMLDKGEEITAADLKACLARQGMSEADLTEGCAAMWRTGWGEMLWMKDNARFNSGCPGIGVDAANWLISKSISVGAADTWPIEVVPNPDPNLAFPVHQMFITRNGIHILENVRLDHLAGDKIYKFAFVFSPVPIKGATGSPGNPLAVV